MTGEKKTYHIGFMAGNIHSQYTRKMLKGIYDAACSEDVKITLFLGSYGNVFDFWRHYDFYHTVSSQSYDYQFDTLYNYANITDVDALVISYGTVCTYFAQQERETFLERFRGVPLVILEEYDEESDDSFLVSDNYQGMCSVMDHLLREHGYRKIVYIGGPRNNMDATTRLQAYLDKMQEAGVTVSDEMIEYGDFSPEVDHLIERILDNNPDAEAIACANDEMTVSAYRVCKQRGLVIGRDIAVTGYDDMEPAHLMDPPLTTARQDSYDMGFKAVRHAIKVCETGEHLKSRIPATLIKRSSCGCSAMSFGSKGRYLIPDRIIGWTEKHEVRRAAEAAAGDCLKNSNIAAVKEACATYFERMITILVKVSNGQLFETDLPQHREKATEAVRKLFEGRGSGYIDIARFTETFHKVVHQIQTKAVDTEAALLIGTVLEATDAYIQKRVLLESEENRSILQQHSWMAPVMIRKMMEQDQDEKSFYLLVVEHIRAQGAKSAWVYLLEEPVRCPRGTQLDCPEKLYLAAEYKDDHAVSFPKNARPVITREGGVAARYPEKAHEGYAFVEFVLFAEEYQYGLMVCEIDVESIEGLYGVGLQISTAQAYLRISREEAEAKNRLYTLMRDLEQKNQILNFTSSTDALTKLYNRRGFLEHAISFVQEHLGQKAVLFFADLDHLKQINDRYGHAEGDFAICESAKVLQSVFSACGYAGRIGGDEYVAISLADEQGAAAYAETIKEKMQTLNEGSEKPYYVDLSLGFETFMCTEDCSVGSLMEQADQSLYEAKKHRRESVEKASK